MKIPITSIIAIALACLALGMNIGRMMKAPDEERNYYLGIVDGKELGRLECEDNYGFPPPAHGKD